MSKRQWEVKELSFAKCPKHGVQYPKGAECPVCKAGKTKKDAG